MNTRSPPSLQGSTYFPSNDYPAETPEQALAKARAVWGDPHLTSATVASLTEFAASFARDEPKWIDYIKASGATSE